MEIKLFIGSYYGEGNGDDWLIFAAAEDCDREAELMKAYHDEYGAELDSADIHAVSAIESAFDYTAKKRYVIEVREEGKE